MAYPFDPELAAAYAEMYGSFMPADTAPPVSLTPTDMSKPLAERTVATFDISYNDRDVSPGRRLRVFASLIRGTTDHKIGPAMRPAWLTPAVALTYAQALDFVTTLPDCENVRAELSVLALHSNAGPNYTAIPETYLHWSGDSTLNMCLQDMANEINEDVREALFVWDDPDLDYPGVDVGIEPVSDEHVDLVIWALQRELKRELRNNGGPRVLHAAPLADLPWHIQRALVERRRLRARQWGIGPREQETNTFSLFNVPLDPDYIPRRQTRLLAGA